eukprot:4486816-Alexandrium_andersonii.AAC.1
MPRPVHTNLARDARAARDCCAEYSCAHPCAAGNGTYTQECATRELRSMTNRRAADPTASGGPCRRES